MLLLPIWACHPGPDVAKLAAIWRVLCLDSQLDNLGRVLLHPGLREREACNWQRCSSGRRLIGPWRAQDAIAEALLVRHDELAVLLLGLLPPCVLLCISRISHKRAAFP